jgi:hypothetical protein
MQSKFPLFQSLAAILIFSFVPAHAQIAHAKKIVIGAYPFLARLAHIEGIVKVDLTIKQGLVESFVFVSGISQLSKSQAFRRVKEWEFDVDCPEHISINVEFSFFTPDKGDDLRGGAASLQEFLSPNTIRILAPRPEPTDTEKLPLPGHMSK